MDNSPKARYFYRYTCNCGHNNLIPVDIPKEADILRVPEPQAPEDIYCGSCKAQVIIPKGDYAPINGELVPVQ